MSIRLAGLGVTFLLVSTLLLGVERPRVFITESQTPRASGDETLANGKGTFEFTGGNSPQNLEVIKAFSRNCPHTVVSSNPDKADFIVRLDHEALSPTTPFVRGNKVAVFDKNQDLIFSDSTRLLGRAVKGACLAILGAK